MIITTPYLFVEYDSLQIHYPVANDTDTTISVIAHMTQSSLSHQQRLRHHHRRNDNDDCCTDILVAVDTARRKKSPIQTKRRKIRILITSITVLFGVSSVGILVALLTVKTTTLITNIHQEREILLSSLRNNDNNHCAINFYGLPRQFRDMIHNGILQNLIVPNLAYQCDYYIHYYNDTTIETTSQQRGADMGHGNTYFDPNEILLLKSNVLQLHYDYFRRHNQSSYQPPIVHFGTTSETDFHQQYSSLLQTIHTYQHPTTQQHLYLPLSEALPFSNTTLINIVKMWHSQQSVFQLMDGNHHNKHYSRVGMFRNDVLYVTPIDIYQIPSTDMDYQTQPKRKKNRLAKSSSLLSYDKHNQYAVIPDFANFPVNDRMIYGPYDAVLIYATFKFRLLQHHIHSKTNHEKQYGIHSEQYLYHAILPMIQQFAHVPILQHSDICFLRVRTDYSIRITDCDRSACLTSISPSSPQHDNNIHTIIEQQLLIRSCRPQLDMTLPHIPFLLCPPNHHDNRTHSEALHSAIGVRSRWEFCPS